MWPFGPLVFTVKYDVISQLRHGYAKDPFCVTRLTCWTLQSCMVRECQIWSLLLFIHHVDFRSKGQVGSLVGSQSNSGLWIDDVHLSVRQHFGKPLRFGICFAIRPYRLQRFLVLVLSSQPILKDLPKDVRVKHNTIVINTTTLLWEDCHRALEVLRTRDQKVAGLNPVVREPWAGVSQIART